jgi:hypothetical protein
MSKPMFVSRFARWRAERKVKRFAYLASTECSCGFEKDAGEDLCLGCHGMP